MPWNGQSLAELRRKGQPEGFIGALRACSRHGVYRQPVPAKICTVLKNALSAPGSEEPIAA
jgi:hypothetical protein